MHRRGYFVAGILFGLMLLTWPAIAQHEDHSFAVSAFSQYQKLPPNKTAMGKTRKEVARTFPQWAAVTDKLSGIFTDIYGKPIALDGTNDREKAKQCITARLRTLGVHADEWMHTGSVKAPKADYENYRQVIDNHPVVFSKLSLRFTKDGLLARVQMKNYGSPATGQAPAIAKDAALETACQGLDGAIIGRRYIEDDWYWFPIPVAEGYILHPAWRFVIDGKDPGSIPLKLVGYVDAITGKLLYRDNEVKATGYDLTVKGMVHKNGITTAPTLEPLTDLNVQAGILSAYTDTDGKYTNALLVLPMSTDVPLTGKWAHIIDSPSASTPTFSTMVSGSMDYTYPTTAPSSSRHVNAYYHTTHMHNFMKKYFPSFTELDLPFIANVDVSGGYCNAYYSGSSINFFAAGGGCNSFAEMADVVSHEYGHAINNAFYNYVCGSGMTNTSLHEGFADTWALSVTHNPVLGKNAYVMGGFVRRYDVIPQVYPIDLNTGYWPDPHKNAQIIAGAWWDLGVALGSVDSMTQLFSDVYYDFPDGPNGTEGTVFQDILVDVLMADDNNSDLSDGTPHCAQILGAFARHGIYACGDAVLSHEELPNQPAGKPIPVSASLYVANPSFVNSFTLFFRVNYTGAWQHITLSNAGFNFTGSLPAQAPGTVVEYYFTANDALGNTIAYFPLACNMAMPAQYTTLPYQFAAGVKTVDSTTFETPQASDYDIGFNPGDDAVFGIWYQDMPTGVPTDHTTGTSIGMCLESKSMGSGMRGTSTVMTPVFDISSFSQPIVSYYRWFSNEFSNINFKNDPWIVKIDGGPGTAWHTVEHTYQSDQSWRRKIFPVSALLPGTSTHMQLKFFASDSMLTDCIGNGQSELVSAIDDIFVYDKGDPEGVTSPAQAGINIYPIPANNYIVAEMPGNGTGTVSLWDMEGKKVAEVNVDGVQKQYTLNTQKLPSGPYNLLVQTGQYIEMKKVTVLH